MARTALVLGAGIGGIVAAEILRKLLPQEHRVVVVERERDHIFAPSLLWHMTDDNDAAAFTRPLSTLSSKGIELVTGELTRIDPATLSVEVGGKTLTGDAMIVALGTDYAPEAIPGLAEAGHNIYTLEGSQTIRAALDAFEGGRIVVLTAAPAYKCPAAPYEAAMLVAAYCKKRRLQKETTVSVYAAEPAPMMVTGPVVGGQVTRMLEMKGIPYFPIHQITRVEAGSLHFANGATAAFDLLLYVPPHRAPVVVKAAGLCAKSGWIAVDRETMETQFPGVYAIGDVTTIPLKMGRPLPKAGVFAHGRLSFMSMPCMHCEQPACRQACPTGAIFKRSDDGMVLIDQSKCIGCRFCAWACPYGAMGFDEERNVADKCTYCAHRLARGEQPACVSKCPGHALSFGKVEALSAQARSQGRSMLNIDAGTKPSTFFLARTKA